MNMDQARAGGGEGTMGQKKKENDKSPKLPIFESEDKEVELKIPDGWSAKKD